MALLKQAYTLPEQGPLKVLALCKSRNQLVTSYGKLAQQNLYHTRFIMVTGTCFSVSVVCCF